MRTGLAVSIVAHIAVLTIGLINLGFTEPLTPAVESISVDLVPVEEGLDPVDPGPEGVDVPRGDPHGATLG